MKSTFPDFSPKITISTPRIATIGNKSHSSRFEKVITQEDYLTHKPELISDSPLSPFLKALTKTDSHLIQHLIKEVSSSRMANQMQR
jgi:hypothetical protein